VTKRLSSIIGAFIAVSVLAAIIVVAIEADGREGTETTSNDGGAWLVNRSKGTIGHVNYRVEELSSAVRASEPNLSFDVFQPGDAVVVHEPATSSLKVLDPRTQLVFNAIDLPGSAEVFEFEGGLVVVAPSPYRVWLLGNATLFETESVESLDPAWVAEDGFSAVGLDGRIAVFDKIEQTITVLDPRTQRPEWATVAADVDELLWDGVSLVVRSGTRVGVANKNGVSYASRDVEAWELTTSPAEYGDGTIVALAQGGALNRIDASTGESALLADLEGARFVAPLEHRGCVVVVAHDPPTRWDICGTDIKEYPLDASPGAVLRLRVVNGWVWVNNVSDGELWYVDTDGQLGKIDDWGAVLPQEIDPNDQTLAPVDADDAIEDQVENADADDSVTVEADEFDEDGINQPPVAFDDDQHETHVERPIVIDVVDNDEDPDNDVLLVAALQNLSADNASVVKTIDGTGVQVTPYAGFEGVIQFQYTVTDGRGGSDTATGSVAVRSRTGTVNSPPVAETDVASITAGEKMRINVLANDFDPDGDTILLLGAEAPTGVIKFDPSGLVIFEPESTSEEGRTELTYTVADEFGETTTGRIIAEVRLKESNQKPDARNDGGVTVVSQPIRLNLLLNDTDPDGDALFVAERPTLLSPTGIDVFTTITPDGEFVFIPEQAGTYMFAYAASDDEAVDIARIRIEVGELAGNSAPVAIRDDVTIPVGESRIVYVLENDGDPDGDVVGIVDLNVAPGSGLRVESFFGVGFRVFVDEAGPAQRSFRYAISDGDSDPVETVVVVTVADAATLNQPPVAEPDVVDARPGARLTVPVLDNDFDPEGGSLEVVGFTNPNGAAVELGPRGQSLRINVASDARVGFDIGYDVADEQGNRAGSLVRVRIVPDGDPNRPPVARPDDARTQFETDLSVAVINNDSDPDGDAITVESVTAQPMNGIARVDALTGEVVYSPSPDFAGTDRFTYSIVDSFGARSEGDVLVGVMPRVGENQDPVARDDSLLTTAIGVTTLIPVLQNDDDPDGDQLRVRSVTAADLGQVVIGVDGGSLTYISPPELSDDQEIAFDYEITDGAGGSATATVVVLIQRTPERTAGSPIAIDDLVDSTRSDTSIEVAVVDNDSDPNGSVDVLVVTVFDPALTVEGQVVVMEAPALTTEYQYQITDEDGNTDVGLIIVTVVDPQPPVAVDDSKGPVQTGDLVTIDVLANDYDPDGEPGGLTIVSTIGAGTRHDGALFQVTAPAESTQYSYVIEDADGEQASATVSLNVADNRAPEVEEFTVTTPFQTSVDIDLASLATDPDGDPLLYSCCSSSTNGTPQVIDAGEGILQIRFTPDDGFDGPAVFAFDVSDQVGHDVSAAVTVFVEAQPNRPPIAVDGSLEVQVPRNGAPAVDSTIDLATLSEDPDGDDLQWSVQGAPGQNLSSSIQGSTLRVTASDQSEAGTTSAQWTVADPDGETSTGTVAIVVTEAQNEAPTASDSTLDLPAGNSEVIDLAALVSDPDADEQLTFELVGTPSGAVTATQTSDVAATVSAAVSASGESTTLSYSVTDRMGESATGTVAIAVVDPDRPLPQAVDDAATTLQGQQVEIPVLANDLDPIGEGLTIFDPGATSDGAVSAAGQVISFDPEPTFFGTATFTYTIRDAGNVPTRESSGVANVEVTGRPDKPSPPVCSPDSTLANLTWTTPANNGAAVAGYELDHDQGGTQALPVANSYIWNDLTNGIEYTFRVRAENAAGWSEWSDSSLACRPDRVPERPSPVQVSHGDKQLDVSWNVPVNEGSAIEEYELRIGGGITQSSIDTEFPWTGLTNGTDYTFQVRARNLAGWSEWSNASAPEHPSTIPAAPAIGTTTRAGLIGATASGILEVHWSAVPVSADGGDTITEYDVEQRGGSTIKVSGANSNSYFWSGLPNGVEYEFRVRAINRDGPGPWSGWSAPLPACTTPGAPTGGSAVRGDRTADVSFTAPGSDGGCEVTHYDTRIAGSSGNGTLHNAPGTKTVTGLTNGTLYAFDIRSNNAIGPSAWVRTNGVTPAGLPICGSSLTSTSIGHTSVALQWSAANFNGGSPQGYELQVNSGSWGAFTSGTQGTRSGLSQNTNYTFRIRARNEIGVSSTCGSVSRLTCGTPPQAPRPTWTSVNQSNNSLTASWGVVTVPCTSQSGVASNYGVTRYEVDRDPGSTSNNGTSRSKAWSSLSSGSYRARARACNTVGCGSWSSWSASETIDPDCPQSSWTVYGQTMDPNLPGASIRSTPGGAVVGGLGPGQSATAVAWTTGPALYPGNPYPQSLGLYVRLTGPVNGYAIIAGVQGSPTTAWANPLYFDNLACRE